LANSTAFSAFILSIPHFSGEDIVDDDESVVNGREFMYATIAMWMAVTK
jgi:hypothetical protein